MLAHTLVSTLTLARHLDDPDWIIVDCRHDLFEVAWGERVYRESHIPGAFFLHLDRDLSGRQTGFNGRHPLPDAQVIADKLAAIGVSAQRQLVAYDQGHSQFAVRLWWLARWLGHARVAVLDGGFQKWTTERRPLSSSQPKASHGACLPRPGTGIVDVQYVLEHLNRSDMLLLDARTPERYRGEAEPIDPVAGHIPGAVNRPYTANLNADLTFKAADILQQEFLALLGGSEPACVVHQCGSGVTACHNLLAMEIAGLSGSRLYPGSWSEWCSDPSRPIAR